MKIVQPFCEAICLLWSVILPPYIKQMLWDALYALTKLGCAAITRCCWLVNISIKSSSYEAVCLVISHPVCWVESQTLPTLPLLSCYENSYTVWRSCFIKYCYTTLWKNCGTAPYLKENFDWLNWKLSASVIVFIIIIVLSYFSGYFKLIFAPRDRF